MAKDRFVSSNYSNTIGDTANMSIFGDRERNAIFIDLYIHGISFTAMNYTWEMEADKFPVAMLMYNTAIEQFKKNEEALEKGGNN